MEEPARKVLFQDIGIAVIVLLAIVGITTLMTLSDVRGHQEKSSVSAGRYVSTAPSGSEGSSDVGIGFGMNGRPIVGAISMGSDLISLVRTDTQTRTVKGGFTDRIGDALFVVTMQNDDRYLCPSTKKNCHQLANDTD